MDTLVESPRVAFVSGSSLPASSPISLSRLILPVLCIALGVSVGSATGLTLALLNTSNQAIAASGDSEQASSPVPAPTADLAMNSSSAPAVQPAIAAAPAVSSAPQAAAFNSAPAITVDHAKPVEPVLNKIETASLKRAVTAKTPSHDEFALNKTPDALKPAVFKMNGKTFRVAKLIDLPIAKTADKPLRHESAQSLPAPAPIEMPAAQDQTLLSLDAPKQASVYTEGILTVEGYDAASGTVETSDGKTFVLGTTVAAGGTASWEDYRSEVHYRCDQNGSCMLTRAGAVAPDARLI